MFSLEQIRNLWKGAVELAERAKNIELKQKLLELREAGLELGEENLEKSRQIKALEQRVDDLQSQLSLKAKLQFDGCAYWIQAQVEGQPADGPYCQRCWDADQKLIRLQSTPLPNGEPWWDCLECGKSVQPPGTAPRGIAQSVAFSNQLRRH